MFADAPWPGHGVFLGHLSLSLPSFLKPGQLLSTFNTEYMYTVHAWLDNTYTYMHSARSVLAIINDVTEIPTAIIAFQSVTDIHTTHSETILQD